MLVKLYSIRQNGQNSAFYQMKPRKRKSHTNTRASWTSFIGHNNTQKQMHRERLSQQSAFKQLHDTPHSLSPPYNEQDF